MKHRNIIALFILGTVLATVASAYQLFDMTDFSTGFFKQHLTKEGSLVTAFSAVVIACIGLVCSQSRRKPRANEKPSVIFVGISAAYAVICIADVFLNGFVATLNPPISTVVIVICIISAVAVLLISIVGREFVGLLAAAPLAYSLIRLVLPFTRFARMPSTAQNMYELAFLCFQLLFWLYSAMLFNKVKTRRATTFLLPISLMAACLCFMLAVPQIIAKIALPEAVHNGTVSPLFLIAFAVYSVYFVLDLFSIKRMLPNVKKDTEEDQNGTNEFYMGDKK